MLASFLFAALAQAWSGPRSVPGDSGGPPYVFTDPHGGFHLLADVSGREEWFNFISAGKLGPGTKLPGEGGQVNEVAWMPDGRAAVAWGSDYLAVRATNGTWGPLYGKAITVQPGEMAVENTEAYVLQDSTSTIQRLLIGSTGKITFGSSASLAKPGDKESTCAGAIAVARRGSPGHAVYSVGNQVRRATLTPPNKWTVGTAQAIKSTDALGCPVGGSANGRLVVTWGEYDGTYPYYNQPAPQTAKVWDATWIPGKALRIGSLSALTTSGSESHIGVIYGASAGPDGSLVAWGGTGACDGNNPLGTDELATGSPAAAGLVSQTGVLASNASSGTDTDYVSSGAFGSEQGAPLSAFKGAALLAGDVNSSGSSSGSPLCSGASGSTLTKAAVLGPAGSDATLRQAPSGTGGDEPISTATDGKGDAVITAMSVSSAGETYVMFVDGKPAGS